MALCEFAKIQTIHPQKNIEIISALRNNGFNDREILDATLVVSYFNFVNRIVLSLGLEVNIDETKGYHYEASI